MKKLKFMSMLAVSLLTAFSLTSCLDDDDDDNRLTTEDQYAYQVILQGRYSGKLKNSYYDSQDWITDSVTTIWYFNADSTYTVYNLPVSFLSRYVTDDETVKNALEAAGTVTAKGQYAVISTQPVVPMLYTLSFNIDYEGTTHQVDLMMTNSSYGVYDQSSQTFNAQLPIYSLYWDLRLNCSIGGQAGYTFDGTKL